jgi:hypothetical protein
MRPKKTLVKPQMHFKIYFGFWHVGYVTHATFKLSGYVLPVAKLLRPSTDFQ